MSVTSGKHLEGYSWWKKISSQRPALADRFLREQKDKGIETSMCSVPPVNVSDNPTSWQAFASECKNNSGMMDSACNKSMIGEYTLQALELVWKKKFGLGIQRLPVEEGESFKLGDAEVVEVKERAILPIGILGFPGELDLSIIPGADTPLLLAKDDLGALGVLVGFGWHKAIYSVLSAQAVALPQSESGHYLMRLDQIRARDSL